MISANRVDNGAWQSMGATLDLRHKKHGWRYRARLACYGVKDGEWAWDMCPHSHADRDSADECGRRLTKERNGKRGASSKRLC